MLEERKSTKIVKSFIVIALMSTTFLFAFLGITRSLRHDECCSVEISNTSWAGILENLKVNAHTPPLYYFLLNLWMEPFGTSEAAVRGLSALFYILSLGAVYQLGKTLYDRKTGLLAAFLFMVSPMAIWHAQDARMYSLLALEAILSTYFFWQLFFFRAGSKAYLAAYVLINVAGTFTHYWFFFVLLSQSVIFLFLLPRSWGRMMVAAFLSIFPFLAFGIPFLLIQLSNGGISELSRPGPQALVSTLLTFYGGSKMGALFYGAFLALVLFEFSGLKPKLRDLSALKAFAGRRLTLAVLLWALVSLLAPWIISQLKPVYVESRYTIIAVPAVALLLGAFLSRYGARIPTLIFCSLLFAAVVLGFVHRRTNPLAVTFKSQSEYLLREIRAGDVLVLCTSSRAGLDYYLGRMNRDNQYAKISFPSEMSAHPCWTNMKKWLADMDYLEKDAGSTVEQIYTLARKDSARIWLISGHHPEIDRIIKLKLAARFSPAATKVPSLFHNQIAVYQKAAAQVPL